MLGGGLLLLLSAAVVAIVMAIDSTVAMANGEGQGMFAQAAYADAKSRMGMTDAEAKEYAGKVDMGVKIAMAVVGIALAIASGGSSLVNGVKNIAQAGAAGAKAGMTAAKTADDAVSIAKTIKDIASAVKTAFTEVRQAYKTAQELADLGKDVSATVTKLANLTGKTTDQIEKGVKIAGTTTRVASAMQEAGTIGADVSSSALKYQATEKSADAKTLSASAKADEAVMQMIDDMIDQALSRLVASGDRFSAMLDSITDSIQDRSNTLSRAQFKG